MNLCSGSHAKPFPCLQEYYSLNLWIKHVLKWLIEGLHMDVPSFLFHVSLIPFPKECHCIFELAVTCLQILEY